ncbi:phosphatase PAP2 family protein [Aestuariibaculum lutulentum]|uniref:Phosphatase PAP2 family protein n=1 Tax=Aestuariibaculum lutulentum TaxID=2920935 RepID=A0ABS9RJU2_9FLAO|nr:phosphatase PAP2 family protein [Aestuariibaculum lutulentum]MCH4553230.1 phosphatase PAP2 family protein [Aestuariibaculum lutulentum]
MTATKYLALTVTLICSVFISNAQTATDSLSTTKEKGRIWQNLKYDGGFVLKSVGNGFTQPLRWQKKDFLTAAGIVAGTGLLYAADTDAHTYFLEQGENAPQVLKEFGWYFGSPQNFFMISAGIYGFGLITDNEKVRETGVLIIGSAVTSGIIQTLSKNIIGRARPTDGDRNDFDMFSKEAGYHSFPSGHTILSVSMAHAIAKQFENIWVKAGIYAVGSIAPISRLWAGAHWLSDVGLGYAIAIVTVDGVDNFMKKKGAYSYAQPNKISWQFKAGYGTLGIVGTF